MLQSIIPNIATIEAIDKLVKAQPIQYADKKLAKTFKTWNVRNVTLDPQNSIRLGYDVRENGVKKPVTILRNSTSLIDYTAKGNHRVDIVCGDSYTLDKLLPYQVITTDMLTKKGFTEKDFLAWAASTNPQYPPSTSKPNNKATLKNVVSTVYTIDDVIQTEPAKEYLIEKCKCSKAYANEIIEEARMVKDKSTYQKRTGRQWRVWSTQDLNVEKAKYTGTSIAMSVGNLTLRTLMEKVVDNDIARKSNQKYDEDFNIILHFGDVGGEKNLAFWRKSKALWYARFNNIMERYDINIDVRVLPHDIEIINPFNTKK
tara:strand:- start:152 stop:1096 length:945 start_codon:yes stop_codon:yes gene_type:complete